jgi:aminoglycoside phosphotransferase (APT) family kinase protein
VPDEVTAEATVTATTDDTMGAALAPWLRDHIAGARSVDVLGLDKPTSGFSAETLVLDARIDYGDGPVEERFVLRKETPDPPVYPQQAPGTDVEIEIQYRVMDAVARHSPVPIAPLVGYEPDPSVLGTQFFVMRHVAGQVPIESPPYTQEGFFVGASPEQRTQLIDRGLQTMAAVHAIDWRAAGLEWLVAPGTTPGWRQQLDVWTAYAERELAGRVHPTYAEGQAWLRAHLPGELPVGLCWGDPRPGNMIWRDFENVCTTDFEAASIAPAEVDLGWWLLFDRTMHEDAGLQGDGTRRSERLPGDVSRDEQRAIYERHAGRPVGDTTWFEIFAGVRYCAIVVRVMNRLVDRGMMPPDHTVWLENPAASALRSLLDEVG